MFSNSSASDHYFQDPTCFKDIGVGASKFLAVRRILDKFLLPESFIPERS